MHRDSTVGAHTKHAAIRALFIRCHPREHAFAFSPGVACAMYASAGADRRCVRKLKAATRDASADGARNHSRLVGERIRREMSAEELALALVHAGPGHESDTVSSAAAQCRGKLTVALAALLRQSLSRVLRQFQRSRTQRRRAWLQLMSATVVSASVDGAAAMQRAMLVPGAG